MSVDREEYLGEFFGGSRWKPPITSKQEHDIIVSETFEHEHVLDLGCGDNLFKGRIKNLTAIDKYNPAADIVVDMLEFQAEENYYDVVVALGSTNFSPFSNIEKQIDNIVKWCKPGGRIYMRVNPGISEVNTPEHFLHRWTLDDIIAFTRKYNLEIIKPITVTQNIRIIWTWQKPL